MADPVLSTLSPALTAPKRRRPFYGWYLVGVAFVVGMVITGMNAYSLSIFLPPMIAELGWTRTQVSAVRSFSSVVSGLSGFAIGPLLDRFGGRRLMVTGAIFGGASWIAMSQVQSIWQFYLFQGIGFALASSLAGSLVANTTLSNWFIRKRGWAISIAALGLSTAGMIAPLLVTFMIDHGGWRTAWVVLGLIVWAVAIPASLLIRRRPEDYGLLPDGDLPHVSAGGTTGPAAATRPAEFRWTRRQVVRTVAFWKLVVTFASGNLIYGALSLHLVTFLIEQGYRPVDAAIAISVQNIAAFCTKPLWGMAADRFDVRYCAATEFSLLAIGNVGIGLFSSSLWQVYAAQLIVGMGIGGLVVVQETVWASFFGRLSLGAIRSMGLPFTVLSGASGPLIAGAIYDVTGSYRPAFALFILTSVVGVSTILTTRVPKPPDAAATTA